MDKPTEHACPDCGTPNVASARFCVRCGTRLAGVCDACGAELPADARFCPECGTPVRQAVAEGQERKLVTVLFSDVEDSTGLGERFDPERLKEVMGAYFDAMQEEIEAEGGTVEKYIGDAVMAVFGVPVAHEDDPVRALRAAHRMLLRLEVLNADLERGYGVRLAQRVGVNTGEVMATAQPAPGRGMVAGDPVNVAARLEQMARPGQVLFGARTARAAARRVTMRGLGSRSVRGKGEALQVFELLDARVAEGVSALERPRETTAPLVGRERELELLETVFQRVRGQGRPHVVTIYGEAGVGKSRLVEELESRAAMHVDGLVTVRGRCVPYGEGVTYWPLAEILKSYAGVLDDDPPALAFSKFAEALSKLLADTEDPDRLQALVRALAFTVGIEDAGGEGEEVDPHRIRSEAEEAWRTFFSSLAMAGPLVAVIEDIHWADDALLDLLEVLADRTMGPVLFICPSRQELRERRPTWGGGWLNFSSLLLEPLSGSESEMLLDQLLGGTDVPPALRRRIVQRAGGNPFFLEEIVRHVLDDRMERGGEGRPGAELEDVVIPETVQGVLAARMDMLQPQDKRVLQEAAVVGKTFWPGAVVRLLEPSTGDGSVVEGALARLEDRGLVLSRLGSTMGGEREFSFRHGLTRDVAYQSLPRRERAGAHAQVGAWIEERAGRRIREFADLLSYHYLEAYQGFADDARLPQEERERLRSKAFEATLVASEVARSKGVLKAAQSYGERALDLAVDDLESSRALEVAGFAYFHDSQGDRAWESLRRAIDLRMAGPDADPGGARDVARLCAAGLEIATRSRGAMRQRVRPDELEPYLQIGLRLAGEGDSEERARLLIARAFWPRAESATSHVDERSFAEARKVGEQGFAMSQRLGKPSLASAALDAICSSFHLQGSYGEMEEPLRRRLELADSLTDPFELGDVYGTAAWWAVNSGRYREALDLADRGFVRTEAGSPLYALYCLDFRAAAAFRLGEWDRFLADVAKADELLGDRRDTPPGFAAVHVAMAAFLHEVQGQAELADRDLRIVEWLEDVEDQPDTAWTLWRSRLLARRGRLDEARALLTRPALEEHGEGREEVLEAWCELIGEGGRWDEAAGVARDARTYGEWAGVMPLPLHAGRLEGRAALAAGDAGQAIDLLTAAAVGFERLEAVWEAAVTRLDAARALLAAGRREEARVGLTGVTPTLERLRCRRELEAASELSERLA